MSKAHFTLNEQTENELRVAIFLENGEFKVLVRDANSDTIITDLPEDVFAVAGHTIETVEDAVRDRLEEKTIGEVKAIGIRRAVKIKFGLIQPKRRKPAKRKRNDREPL